MVVFAAAPTLSDVCHREPVTVGMSPSFSFVLPSLYNDVTAVPEPRRAAIMVDCAVETVSTFLWGVTLLCAAGPRCAAVVVPVIPLSLLIVTLPGSPTTPDLVISAA
jgi:hypothetical protein